MNNVPFSTLGGNYVHKNGCELSRWSAETEVIVPMQEIKASTLAEAPGEDKIQQSTKPKPAKRNWVG